MQFCHFLEYENSQTAQNMLILFKNGIELVLYCTPTSISCLPEKKVLVQTICDYQLHNILRFYQTPINPVNAGFILEQHTRLNSYLLKIHTKNK